MEQRGGVTKVGKPILLARREEAGVLEGSMRQNIQVPEIRVVHQSRSHTGLQYWLSEKQMHISKQIRETDAHLEADKAVLYATTNNQTMEIKHI